MEELLLVGLLIQNLYLIKLDVNATQFGIENYNHKEINPIAEIYTNRKKYNELMLSAMIGVILIKVTFDKINKSNLLNQIFMGSLAIIETCCIQSWYENWYYIEEKSIKSKFILISF